jgi:hypothetical protein
MCSASDVFARHQSVTKGLRKKECATHPLWSQHARWHKEEKVPNIDQDDSPVSREAHERVKRERDASAAKLAELEGVVKDMGLREKAIDFFRAQSADDPVRWATVALPHLRETALEDIPSKLADLFPAVPKAGIPAVPEDTPLSPPSGFNTRQPNPAATGQAPKTEALKVGSAEVRKILAEQGIAGLRKLDADGGIVWSEDNLEAQGLRKR